MNLTIDSADYEEVIFALEARARAAGHGTSSYRVCMKLAERIRKHRTEEHAQSNGKGKIAGIDSKPFKEF